MQNSENVLAPDGDLEYSSHLRGKALDGITGARVVTTSWDDGSPIDLRVAEILAERGLNGTFYVPVKGHYKCGRMDAAEMTRLDRGGFEIGAHGVSHGNLTRCEPPRLAVEVENSKKRIEDDLGKEVAMFAYPRGRYNGHVIASVKQAGFVGARTTSMLSCALSFDPFRMPTSLHAFPHSRMDYLRNLSRVMGWKRSWVYATHLRCANNWIALAKLLFDSVLQRGGVWHIYGHSWEIEEFDLWDGLKEVLDYVAKRPKVQYVANSTVVSLRETKSLALKAALTKS